MRVPFDTNLLPLKEEQYAITRNGSKVYELRISHHMKKLNENYPIIGILNDIFDDWSESGHYYHPDGEHGGDNKFDLMEIENGIKKVKVEEFSLEKLFYGNSLLCNLKKVR